MWRICRFALPRRILAFDEFASEAAAGQPAAVGVVLNLIYQSQGALWEEMMQFRLEKVGNEEVYYHALYHHVAHWAAYAAMMAVLLSVAAILSVSQIKLTCAVRIVGVFCAVGAATAGAVYFMLGMKTYGAILCEAVPDNYLLRTQTFRHNTTVLLGIVAALGCGAGDLFLLWHLTR